MNKNPFQTFSTKLRSHPTLAGTTGVAGIPLATFPELFLNLNIFLKKESAVEASFVALAVAEEGPLFDVVEGAEPAAPMYPPPPPPIDDVEEVEAVSGLGGVGVRLRNIPAKAPPAPPPITLDREVREDLLYVSMIYLSCKALKAPLLHFLIKSTASIGARPASIKTMATMRGALPRPATQWT